MVTAATGVPDWTSHCHFISRMWLLFTSMTPHWSLGVGWVSVLPLLGLHAMSLIAFSGKSSVLHVKSLCSLIITCFSSGQWDRGEQWHGEMQEQPMALTVLLPTQCNAHTLFGRPSVPGCSLGLSPFYLIFCPWQLGRILPVNPKETA